MAWATEKNALSVANPFSKKTCATMLDLLPWCTIFLCLVCPTVRDRHRKQQQRVHVRKGCNEIESHARGEERTCLAASAQALRQESVFHPVFSLSPSAREGCHTPETPRSKRNCSACSFSVVGDSNPWVIFFHTFSVPSNIGMKMMRSGTIGCLHYFSKKLQ